MLRPGSDPPVTFGVGTVSLGASGGGSSNPVSYTVLAGPGGVSGSTLTVTGAGSIVIEATQAGDSNYNDANPVVQTLTVHQANQTIQKKIDAAQKTLQRDPKNQAALTQVVTGHYQLATSTEDQNSNYTPASRTELLTTFSAADWESYNHLVNWLRETDVASGALKVGDNAPDFLLPDADGRLHSSQQLRRKGPLVLSFFRGGWCPFCSMKKCWGLFSNPSSLT